jgi:hypothetical protein
MKQLKVVITIKNYDEVMENINKAKALIKELEECLWKIRKLNVARHGKTLREIMGCRESFGDFRIGDTVRIKSNGLTGKVMMIGRFGLVSLHIPDQPIVASRPYDPSELTLVREEGSNNQ